MRKEMMRSTGKRLLAVGLALSMVVLAQGVKAEAAHAPYCKATLVDVECTGPMRTTGYSHVYFYGENGPLYCSITEYFGPHRISCSGCKQTLYTESRTCYKDHSACDSELNLCQY